MVTLQDVAKKANVSVMTVSRIINNPEKVKESTRQKVQKIIEELGYHPNFLAKSLVEGNTKTLGVLYSNIYNQAYLDIITGIDEYAYSKGYSILSTNVDNFDHAVKALDMIIGNRIEGLIVLPMEMSMSTREDFDVSIDEMEKFYRYLEKTLDKCNIKCVTISEKIKGAINISFDYVKTASIAMDYLLERFSDITMISSIILDGLWQEKEQVYISKMTEKGLADKIRIVRDVNIVQGGYNAMTAIIESGKLPQAVFCANDYYAIGAVQSALTHKIKIPEDVSIIGNDDIQFSKMTFPQITTVSLNAKEAGKRSVRTLLKLISGKECDDKVMKHFLVERGSVGEKRKV